MHSKSGGQNHYATTHHPGGGLQAAGLSAETLLDFDTPNLTITPAIGDSPDRHRSGTVIAAQTATPSQMIGTIYPRDGRVS